MPYLKTPLTDVTGHLFNAQGTKCEDFELNFYQCTTAYGLHKQAQHKCKLEMEDFVECMTKAKKNERMKEMRRERNRQYYAGERTQRYMDPPPKDL